MKMCYNCGAFLPHVSYSGVVVLMIISGLAGAGLYVVFTGGG